MGFRFRGLDSFTLSIAEADATELRSKMAELARAKMAEQAHVQQANQAAPPAPSHCGRCGAASSGGRFCVECGGPIGTWGNGYEKAERTQLAAIVRRVLSARSSRARFSDDQVRVRSSSTSVARGEGCLAFDRDADRGVRSLLSEYFGEPWVSMRVGGRLMGLHRRDQAHRSRLSKKLAERRQPEAPGDVLRALSAQARA